MPTKKRLKWTGKFRDQRTGKYRVWWSAGAWTLSYDGARISRHASREQAKRKAAKQPRPKKATRALAISKAIAALIRVKAHKRHDVAASVARHSDLAAMQHAPVTVDPHAVITGASQSADNGPAALLLASAGPAGTEPSLVKLPQPDLPVGWGRDLDAIEYEHTRSADPDPRDNEDQEIACLILTARSELAEECAESGIKAVLAARDHPPLRSAHLFRIGIDSDGENTIDGKRCW
jgi:hypothetical protein